MTSYTTFSEGYKMYPTISHALTVVDVYDVAASIGKDFELLIDRYGTEAVMSLMPKVIRVLENLEEYVNRFESEGKEISALQSAIERLESEKVARALDRSSYEKELEQIEETWSSESQELLKMVDRLQEENRRLNDQIDELKNIDKSTSKSDKSEQGDNEPAKSLPADITLISKLKEKVDKQRMLIRTLKKDIVQKKIDIETLDQQNNNLARDYSDLKRQFCVSKKQTCQLLEEKSDLEVQLQAKEQMLRQMKGHIEPDNMETSIVMDESAAISPPVSPKDYHVENFVAELNTEGKMLPLQQLQNMQLSAEDDLYRPRFTMQELREVFVERNKLKVKLVEVEGELESFRKAGDDDLPVQGPINKEPPEKLRPYNQESSSIKQFFQKLMDRMN